MKILAIDPSVNNVGIALYDTETKVLRTSLFHPRRLDHRVREAQQIIGHLTLRYDLQKEKGIRLSAAILEYPNFQGSTKGLIAAQKGYTLDLAFVVGYVASQLPVSCFDIHLPTPMNWKKNVPKAATELRVRRAFGTLCPAFNFDAISEHEFDAIGMINWFLGQKKVL